MTRRVRVALLTPSLDPGGAERQMLMLASALPREVFDLQFIALSEPGSLAAEAREMGMPVRVLGLRREACARLTLRCPRVAVRAADRYLRLARRIDVVDAWLVPAYTFAGIMQPVARVPVLLAGRRSALDVRRTRTWYRGMAERLAMRSVDAVVANSQAAADQAIAIEHIDRDRVHVVRNAVRPAEPPVRRDATRAAWGWSGDELVAGCVGNLKPGKGHGLLLDVVDRLRERCPRLRYVLIGDGPLRGWVETEIRRRHLEGLVSLRTDERDARPLYGAFDIAIQASDSEGLPNTVLEAAAAGLPIVATDVGGTGEIVTSGVDGLLVGRNDAAGLAEALERLAGDQHLRQRLGQAALQRSYEFSPARLAQLLGEVYLRLAAASTRDRVA